jgi:hypothetical protein
VGIYGYGFMTAGMKVMSLFVNEGLTIIQNDLIVECVRSFFRYYYDVLRRRRSSPVAHLSSRTRPPPHRRVPSSSSLSPASRRAARWGGDAARVRARAAQRHDCHPQKLLLRSLDRRRSIAR